MSAVQGPGDRSPHLVKCFGHDFARVAHQVDFARALQLDDRALRLDFRSPGRTRWSFQAVRGQAMFEKSEGSDGRLIMSLVG